jgi:hypothetical protein
MRVKEPDDIAVIVLLPDDWAELRRLYAARKSLPRIGV